MVCKAVLFDLIGTTVKENDPDTINNCFLKAFRDNNVIADKDLFISNRGKDKMEIIRLMLIDSRENNIADSIYNSFNKNVENNLNNFSAAADAIQVFSYLRRQSIKIGLGTGLSRDLFEKILSHLTWDKELFDYIGIASEIGKSRPHPAMVLDMMHKCNIANPQELLKIGDTVADIQEGKNANVKTAVLLAGTQPAQELINEKPDFIFNDLIEIQNILSYQKL